MRTLKIAVPAGIGDVSWIWSKLINIPDTIFEIYTPDTYPQRTFYWMKLLGDRVIPSLGKHGYNDILLNEMMRNYENYSSWKSILDKHEEHEVIYLQPNQWFLSGKWLRDWMPDLETNFHYDMFIDPKDEQSALEKIKYIKNPIGIHMASIKGSRAWNAWLPEDWTIFIEELHKNFPDATPVLLGGNWDMDQAMEVIGRLDPKIPILDLIGKTNIGEAITILKNLKYYIGFSSGLNVMMNVLGKPCTAMWPKHQREHMYCHVDPKMIDDRKYFGFVYDDPKRILLRCKPIIESQLR